MKRSLIVLLTVSTLGTSVFNCAASELVLKAAKDTFCRSNKQFQNSGGNAYMVVAQSPSIKSIIGFDLAGITNEIVSAEFRFRKHNTMEDSITLVVAPMVKTKNNDLWGEGIGALGVFGQNARIGEATFSRRAHRDEAWESASTTPLVNMMDAKLWTSPVATLSHLDWNEGEWVSVSLNASQLEKLRLIEDKVKPITLGLWGTAGNGLYFISTKESGNAPELVLMLKDDLPAE